MKFWGRGIIATGICASLAAVGISVAADQDVTMADLPPAVKATLEQQAAGATIGEIELEDKNGRKIYTAELEQNGKEREIMISPDGKYLGEEAEDHDDGEGDDDDDNETPIELSQAPEPVRLRVQEIAGGASIKEMTMETEGAAKIYEAEYDVNGQEHSVKMAEDGSVIEIEKHMAVESLPAAISNAIKQKFPTGTVKEVEQVEKRFISVEITDGGKEHEIKFSPSGAILESEDDD